jgi:callose synthase
MAASTSGVKPARSFSRRQTRQLDLANEDEKVIDSELVPSSLNPIIPILRVANEIQNQNPRVAYLCKPHHNSLIKMKRYIINLVRQLGRFHAFEKAHHMDPKSTGRGVRQFKTYLLHKLEEVHFPLLI